MDSRPTVGIMIVKMGFRIASRSLPYRPSNVLYKPMTSHRLGYSYWRCELKIFIAGHLGMVGAALQRGASNRYEIVTQARSDLDLANHSKVLEFFKTNSIQGVILSAAKVGGIGANSKFQKTSYLKI